MVYKYLLVSGVQKAGRDKLRSLKMAVMGSSLVNPIGVCSCPMAEVLTVVTGSPMIARLVEGKAF